MLKLVEVPVIKPAAERTTVGRTEDANNVFRVMHGFYGNLFLSKFINGQTDDAGVDQGVVSARAIWSHCLRDFELATVKTALARTIDTHPEYPPTLPQFVALCKACAPRQAYQHAALPMSSALQTEKANAARDAALKSIRPASQVEAAPQGLQLLKLLIAEAVGLAGGDEAKELARLDRAYPGVPA